MNIIKHVHLFNCVYFYICSISYIFTEKFNIFTENDLNKKH